MILAAGLGTRLRPLTLGKPKALVPVGNTPVIDRVIEYLKWQGIDDVIINAHHHHQQIVEHVQGGRPFGIDIQVRVEPEILGTGGGIGNTVDFWRADPFVVINSDILTDVDITKAYAVHKHNKSLATLILHDRPPFNQIQVDSRMNITDIADANRTDRLAFTGIHIIDPELLEYIPRGIFSSIVTTYRDLIRFGKPIRAYVSKGHYWRDIGTVKSYLLANKEALKGDSFLVGPGGEIPGSLKLEDWAVIGERSRFSEGVEIRRSVLWENVTVREGIRVVDSIVTTSRIVKCDMKNEVL
jgi:NDP-sugar pyrophosphorylase family protein